MDRNKPEGVDSLSLSLSEAQLPGLEGPNILFEGTLKHASRIGRMYCCTRVNAHRLSIHWSLRPPIITHRKGPSFDKRHTQAIVN